MTTSRLTREHAAHFARIALGHVGREYPAGDPRRAMAHEAAHEHLAAGLPHIAEHYMGEHWLASFAVLALDDEK